MGLWRIMEPSLYGEYELWVPDRGKPADWPAGAETPPCEVCSGRLTRRPYRFVGRDGGEYAGHRYTLTHYGKRHDTNPSRVDHRSGERRKVS